MDENGNVFGLSAGSATITAEGGLNNQETATLIVHVVERSVSSLSVKTMPTKTVYNQGDSINLYGLVLNVFYNNGDSETVSSGISAQYDFSGAGTKQVKVCFGNAYATFNVTVNSAVPSTITSGEFTVKNGFISKIPIGMTVFNLVSGINEKQYIKVYDRNGIQITSGNVATGMTVRLMDGITIKQTILVVVTGDVNGDGKVSLTDYAKMKSHLLNIENLTGPFLLAADINGDGNVTLTDYAKMKACILGQEPILPKTY